MKSEIQNVVVRHLRGVVIAMVLLVASCGGGTGASPSGPSVGGINGGGFARGAITGFGSIFVDGIEFSTSGASIRIEGSTATESQLEVGQVVLVQGTISDDGRSGTARTVSFDDNVEGPIQSVDVQANTFVVLGQTVRVTGTTVFDGGVSPANITGLTAGVSVEVSGFADSAGVIVATRVEGKAAAGELEVSGALSGLDTVARRFTINALTIDYATATVSGGTLANGACVEVKSNAPTGNTFVATRVEVKPCGLLAAANDRGQIEGIITRFVSATDFDVNGQRVTTTASTTYVNGMASASASDLRLDLKVEVEGTFNAAGTLQAGKVEIKPESRSRLLGTVDALNAGANTLSMYGIDVAINASTLMEDKSSARISPLRFPDLRTGDYLEVRGFKGAAANSIVAVLVERGDLDTRRELQGRVTAVARPNLTILEVSITTRDGTQFRNVDDSPMTADEFFAAIGDQFVKVRGTWNGAAFAADEAQLETP